MLLPRRHVVMVLHLAVLPILLLDLSSAVVEQPHVYSLVIAQLPPRALQHRHVLLTLALLTAQSCLVVYVKAQTVVPVVGLE